MEKNSKIYVAGHKGMLGSAIVRNLEGQGYWNIVKRTSQELDLTNQHNVADFFSTEKPEYVFLSAAKVGGINANIKFPVEFLLHNMQIQNNVIEQSFLNGVRKFIFLGSSCIYPKSCAQPMREEDMLTGLLEPTNEGYALAKIVGIKLLKYYREQYGFDGISLMPSNLYGPNDSFDLEHSHVLSALVKKFCDAKLCNASSVTIWGNGEAKREFMHVDDAAIACIYMANKYDDAEIINIGVGKDISIKELANLIASLVGYDREIIWDESKPNGMLRKCMDVTKMHEMGFAPSISLEDGIKEMISIYTNTINKLL